MSFAKAKTRAAAGTPLQSATSCSTLSPCKIIGFSAAALCRLFLWGPHERQYGQDKG